MTLGQKIRQAREAKGLSQSQVGQLFGISRSAVSQWESDAVVPETQKLKALAAALGKDVGWLLENGKDQPVFEVPHYGQPALPDRAFPVQFGARDLPVFGSAKGSFSGEAVDSSSPVEWILRPPVLAGVKNAFGVYVVGTSMEPRYHQGEIVLVHPGRPKGRGAYVVVLLTDDTAIVKRLLRQTDDFWEVEQLNPPAKEKLPATRVAKVYCIVGTQQG